MITIYKYPLDIPGTQAIQMPEDAKILHVGMQLGQLCLWARVNPDQPLVSREIQVLGTGHELPNTSGRYIGTVIDDAYRLVWHVFERV